MVTAATRSVFGILTCAVCGLLAAVLAMPFPSLAATAPAIANQDSRNLASLSVRSGRSREVPRYQTGGCWAIGALPTSGSL